MPVDVVLGHGLVAGELGNVGPGGAESKVSGACSGALCHTRDRRVHDTIRCGVGEMISDSRRFARISGASVRARESSEREGEGEGEGEGFVHQLKYCLKY